MEGYKNKLILGALAISLAVGCAGQKFRPYEPAEASQGADSQRRVRYRLAEFGLTVRPESNNDMVITEWTTITQMGSQFRLRWMITFDGTTVRVVSQCKRSMTQGDFLDGSKPEEDCGDRQPEQVIAQQKDILSAI